MNLSLRAFTAVIATTVLSGAAFGQVKSGGLVNLTPCTGFHISGRRIVSQLDIVEFYVPRFAHVTKGADADYSTISVRYGPEADAKWLGFIFGVLASKDSPDDLGRTSIKWTSKPWGCHGDHDGTDWHGVGEDGRRWRHISVPFGFATYKGVPPKAAQYFDKILDTMCCGKCPYCKK